MRFKLSAVAILGIFALYAVFWFTMANKFEEELNNFAADEAAKGNEVHWESFNITGFPYRMRAELGGVAYVQNVGRSNMRFVMTNTLVADILPYKLNHVILDFPTAVIIDQQAPGDDTARRQTIFDFDTAHMSVVRTDQGARIGFEGTTAKITGTPNGPFEAARINFFMRPGADARALDVYVEADDARAVNFDQHPYTVKAKAVVEQGEVLFHGLTMKDWAEVGGEVKDIDISIAAPEFTIYSLGKAELSDDGVLRANLDTTVNRTDAFLDFVGSRQSWSQENRQLIGSLVTMADLSDGAADQKAKVTLVANDQAIMAGPFRISDPVQFGKQLGF